MERAIDAMIEKLEQYPSTPYTQDAVNNLKGAFEALEISRRLDAQDRDDGRRPDPPPPAMRTESIDPGVGP